MTTVETTDRLNLLMADLWRDMDERKIRAAKEDPEAFRDSRLFDRPLRWRYCQHRNGRGQRVRHCYATTPNVAGYYLVWREVVTKGGDGRRDRWRSTAKRTDARNIALDRHRADTETEN